jgi:formyl-CoA transferase
VFVRLAAAMDRPELASDPRYSNHAARGAHQDELEQLVAEWAAGFSHEELTSLLDRHSVPNSTVSTIEDIFEDPQLRARGMLVEVPDEQLGTVVQPGIIPRLTRSTGEIGWSGPLTPGSHNRDIYGGLLKLSDKELQDAKDEGAI